MKQRFLVAIEQTKTTLIEVDAETGGDIYNIFNDTWPRGSIALMNAGHIVDQKEGEERIAEISLTNGKPSQ